MKSGVRHVLLICTAISILACQATAIIPTPTNSLLTSTLVPATETSTAIPVPTDTATITPTATIPPVVNELPGSTLPAGFSLIKFADVYRPTAFAFDVQGNLFVTSTDGKIYRLTDINGDGRVDSQTIFAAGYYLPLGITMRSSTGDIYVSDQGGITMLQDVNGDGVADTHKVIVDNLPTDLHQNDNLRFGLDDWLYMGLGSTCDACAELNPKSGTILRFNVDTGENEIYATGLRNPYDLAFDPLTGDLFATDNGRDDLGMDAPLEELNQIVQGGNYGWPNCWTEQNQPGCENTIPAVAHFEAHSSADGLDFYKGSAFPEEYHGNAFVSIFGSWLKPGVQTGIQRVVLNKVDDKYSGNSSWFVIFPEGVMPLPVLFGPDDALYVGDYINSAIYRISYGIP